MDDHPFSNREIKEMFKDVERGFSLLSEQIRDGFANTHSRQDKTNGRVTHLEKRHYMFLGALSVLTAILLPILGWGLYTLVTIQQQVRVEVQQGVQQELSKYEVNVQP